jgi:chromosome partitioning protein
MVMPVIASPVDIRAAERFIKELFGLKGKINNKIKIATVANRVREDTLIAAQLEHYLQNIKLPNGKKLPFMTVLRQSQNYIRAAEQGLSIFELAPHKTYYDREQWEPLLRWLNSKKSIPGG